MEAFYGRKRDEEVKTAAGSVVAYELWRETGEQKILDEIEAYNRIDCISSAELRDWMVSIRPTAPLPELATDASDKEDGGENGRDSGGERGGTKEEDRGG